MSIRSNATNRGGQVADYGGICLNCHALSTDWTALEVKTSAHVEKIIAGHLRKDQYHRTNVNGISRFHLHRATNTNGVKIFVMCLYKRTTHLSWNASRNNDNLNVLKCLVELVSGITFHLHIRSDQTKPSSQPKAKNHTSDPVSTWLTSAATPGAPRIS